MLLQLETQFFSNAMANIHTMHRAYARENPLSRAQEKHDINFNKKKKTPRLVVSLSSPLKDRTFHSRWAQRKNKNNPGTLLVQSSKETQITDRNFSKYTKRLSFLANMHQ